jgi:nucleoside-diphosphate-sugar epimerase
MEQRRPVLISGANGFVGAHLAYTLAAAGWEVRAMVRHEHALSWFPTSIERFVVSDATSAQSWREVTKGVGSVIHLIAKTHLPPKRGEVDPGYHAVNVGITRALLEACASSAVARFVYMSSIKAVGEGDARPYSEDTPCNPEDQYGRTKREAELLVAETGARTGMDVVVLRPPLIYGPGVKGNFLQILKLVDHRFPFPISGIHNKRSMFYVGNLTSAIATLLERDRFPELIFHVADGGEPLSTQDLVRQLGRLMGRRVVLLPAPKPLLRLGGTLLGRRDLVDRLVGSLTVSTDRIESALDWTPPVSVAEGLRQTVEWYLSMRETKHGNSNAC